MGFRFSPCSPCCSGTCRWVCGPFVVFDAPIDGGDAALASLTVATDGSIASVRLLSGGDFYTVAHPRSIVSGGQGSGATLYATVGSIVTLAVTDGGKGYSAISPPNVTVPAPAAGGDPASVTAVVDAATGAVTNLVLVNGGSLFAGSVMNLTIDPPASGRTATGQAYARPGKVTSLVLTAPGSGYTDNAVPDYLNFTISCPAWNYGFRLNKGAGVSAGTPGGFTPEGTLGMCNYGAIATVDMPSAGKNTDLSGVRIAVGVNYTQFFGPAISVNFLNVYYDDSAGFLCPCGTGGAVQIWGMTTVPGRPTSLINDDTPFGPNSPNQVSCSSRPFSWSKVTQVGPIFVFCGTGPYTDWYTLMGGECSDPAPQPNIPLTITLSEP